MLQHLMPSIIVTVYEKFIINRKRIGSIQIGDSDNQNNQYIIRYKHMKLDGTQHSLFGKSIILVNKT